MKSSPASTLIVLVASSFGLLFAAGCIHPNVPSVRYGDGFYPHPAAARSGDVVADLVNSPETYFHSEDIAGPPVHHQELACGNEGLLGDDFASHRQPDTPEAPWPRFHPLPTRPVLGGKMPTN